MRTLALVWQIQQGMMLPWHAPTKAPHVRLSSNALINVLLLMLVAAQGRVRGPGPAVSESLAVMREFVPDSSAQHSAVM
jgi:hypothetical protein